MKKKPDRKLVVAVLVLMTGAVAMNSFAALKGSSNASGGASAPPAVTKLMSGAS